ncbi:alpha-glucuronidase family glycosyl hydrolase [Butyrivibrio sp. VCD2006]|uniref:alpha-glucuronidase family glycosyl hydrolase n=1 Tax=Butyrivibrio sp. VCD2006 TaxID=1280664 RepID=UPI00041FB20F|nr:alpha-glucuronidase family glycosyl hydrolase [Butyrivibrio sp. VCD2006]
MWTQCWLDYKEGKEKAAEFEKLFSGVALPESSEVTAAFDEINKVSRIWFDKDVRKADEKDAAIVLKLISKDEFAGYVNKEGTDLQKKSVEDADILRDSYRISYDDNRLVVEATSREGLIFGTFRMIALMRLGKLEEGKSCLEVPSNPIRMLDHWDNMDGSIERGYSGRSFFYVNNEIIIDDRTRDYARLLASMGINAVAINNVNVKDAACELIGDRFLSKVKELTDLFDFYGVKMYVCINFASPIDTPIGSADPLNEEVQAWWNAKAKEVYDRIPNLGGFLVKADSEGRPGPMTYGRTQADGANMLAKALAPFNATVIWRCFVYNCQQDWRDLTTDRAKAGYDYFSQLDGSFADNVILQIKNGPMDFQVREPVSPLFGGLSKTRQMLEVQIAQEYTGHQIDLCYLMPWFKEILSFETYLPDVEDSTVAGIISGRADKKLRGGMVAVTNTGNDENWTGNDLAAANLYGFGRLAWNTELSAEEIVEEWSELTYPMISAEDQKTICDLELGSWRTYENYTSPLGIGWMVTPHDHYGPCVDGYEYDRWGTYHRADWQGIGVERGPEGTGFALQYRSPNKENFSDPATTPEELLLFFHKTPYTHVLSSGKTVIQHIYDTHFAGYEEAKEMLKKWESLKGKVPARVYDNVSERFERQVRNAREWCDIVNSYFYRKCGIPDDQGRTIY